MSLSMRTGATDIDALPTVIGSEREIDIAMRASMLSRSMRKSESSTD